MKSTHLIVSIIASCIIIGLLSYKFINKKSQTTINVSSMEFPYDLNNPDNKYKLPNSLNEISGICFFSEKVLAGVQDELGKIYFYNLDAMEIENMLTFKRKGDFEDIAVVGSDIWVLQSNGTLYRVRKNGDEVETEKYKTPLSPKNDTEGLFYDKKNNCLLIACKKSPLLEGRNKDNDLKAIYSFDLETKTLNETPEITVAIDEIEAFIKLNYNSDDKIHFEPSGIAIHPQSGHIYIIASAGELLVVLDENKNIIFVEPLVENIFKQPEGIAFSDDGTMYISNEGKKGKANILAFKEIE